MDAVETSLEGPPTAMTLEQLLGGEDAAPVKDEEKFGVLSNGQPLEESDHQSPNHRSSVTKRSLNTTTEVVEMERLQRRGSMTKRTSETNPDGSRRRSLLFGFTRRKSDASSQAKDGEGDDINDLAKEYERVQSVLASAQEQPVPVDEPSTSVGNAISGDAKPEVSSEPVDSDRLSPGNPNSVVSSRRKSVTQDALAAAGAISNRKRESLTIDMNGRAQSSGDDVANVPERRLSTSTPMSSDGRRLSSSGGGGSSPQNNASRPFVNNAETTASPRRISATAASASLLGGLARRFSLTTKPSGEQSAAGEQVEQIAAADATSIEQPNGAVEVDDLPAKVSSAKQEDEPPTDFELQLASIATQMKKRTKQNSSRFSIEPADSRRASSLMTGSSGEQQPGRIGPKSTGGGFILHEISEVPRPTDWDDTGSERFKTVAPLPLLFPEGGNEDHPRIEHARRPSATVTFSPSVPVEQSIASEENANLQSSPTRRASSAVNNSGETTSHARRPSVTFSPVLIEETILEQPKSEQASLVAGASSEALMMSNDDTAGALPTPRRRSSLIGAMRRRSSNGTSPPEASPGAMEVDSSAEESSSPSRRSSQSKRTSFLGSLAATAAAAVFGSTVSNTEETEAVTTTTTTRAAPATTEDDFESRISPSQSLADSTTIDGGSTIAGFSDDSTEEEDPHQPTRAMSTMNSRARKGQRQQDDEEESPSSDNDNNTSALGNPKRPSIYEMMADASNARRRSSTVLVAAKLLEQASSLIGEHNNETKVETPSEVIEEQVAPMRSDDTESAEAIDRAQRALTALQQQPLELQQLIIEEEEKTSSSPPPPSHRELTDEEKLELEVAQARKESKNLMKILQNLTAKAAELGSLEQELAKIEREKQSKKDEAQQALDKTMVEQEDVDRQIQALLQRKKALCLKADELEETVIEQEVLERKAGEERGYAKLAIEQTLTDKAEMMRKYQELQAKYPEDIRVVTKKEIDLESGVTQPRARRLTYPVRGAAAPAAPLALRGFFQLKKDTTVDKIAGSNKASATTRQILFTAPGGTSSAVTVSTTSAGPKTADGFRKRAPTVNRKKEQDPAEVGKDMTEVVNNAQHPYELPMPSGRATLLGAVQKGTPLKKAPPPMEQKYRQSRTSISSVGTMISTPNTPSGRINGAGTLSDQQFELSMTGDDGQPRTSAMESLMQTISARREVMEVPLREGSCEEDWA